jgi:acyl-coenzyme A synthetase/AMP-(fatty) acid ligase
MNFMDEIAKTAAARPTHLALAEAGRQLTFEAYIAAVVDLAGRMRAWGVGTGDLVGLRLGDDVDHLLALSAAAWLGAGTMSLDWRTKPKDAREMLDRAGVHRLVAIRPDDAYAGFEAVSFAELMATPPATAPARPVAAADEIFMVNATSGTTGAPRSVAVSHQDYRHRIDRFGLQFGSVVGFRHLSVLPLCFSGGRNWCIYALSAGAATFMHPSLFSAHDYLAAVREHHIDVGNLVPTAVRWLLDYAEQNRSTGPLLPGFKILTIVGDALHARELHQAKQRLTPNIYHPYGTSGTGSLSCLLPQDIDAHADSVGRPHAIITLEIVDASGRPLAAGREGFVRCKGPGTPSVDSADSGADLRGNDDGTIRDGWFYTGEIGVLDDDGYLCIKGRVSDVIIRGGVNISPGEIEEAMLAIDGVSEAAVVAKPSELLGETVAAFVVANTSVDAKAIKRQCRMVLAQHKVPEDIYIVEKLPKTTSGKVMKSVLTERFKPAASGPSLKS